MNSSSPTNDNQLHRECADYAVTIPRHHVLRLETGDVPITVGLLLVLEPRLADVLSNAKRVHDAGAVFCDPWHDEVAPIELMLSELVGPNRFDQHAILSSQVAMQVIVDQVMVIYPPDRPSAKKNRMIKICQSYPRAYEPWSAEEEDRLRGQWQRGVNVDTIAAELQRQPSAVNSRLLRLGCVPRGEAGGGNGRRNRGKASERRRKVTLEVAASVLGAAIPARCD
jgi:hypothetical protein